MACGLQQIAASRIELVPASASRIPPPNDTESDQDFREIAPLERGRILI
ncbi:hypothetical protein RMSM_07237 [Rhodopirellula maiorica SM1]|uniref:Uncharacterized protein n=1 Tax=Rhodopirellula maiorica SM1 TaxID=1265738 RepID=M5R8N1_9BACT|nr:hypothetical protein RMSM_07237 [Rhodopirellula maiorica SM1]